MTPDRRARAVAREVLGSDIMNVHHRGEQNAPTRPGQDGSDPFRELGPMFPPEWLKTLFVPAVDVGETPSTYLLEADLPGMTEKDVEVSLTGNRLTLSGERDEEKRDESAIHYACERPHGVFTRSFVLPADADTDRASADLQNGVLTITVPKKQETQPRRTA